MVKVLDVFFEMNRAKEKLKNSILGGGHSMQF
jgi:hypothetical protein